MKYTTPNMVATAGKVKKSTTTNTARINLMINVIFKSYSPIMEQL